MLPEQKVKHTVMCVSSNDCIIVGFIRGTHGLTGEMCVESASGEYEHLLNLKNVFLPQGSTESFEKKEYKVESSGKSNAFMYMKLYGIDTVEAAGKYVGKPLFVDRRFAKPLRRNEWYIDDLVGLKVIFQKRSVARVVAVIEGGGGWLFEVLSEDSGKTLYVPLDFHFIKNINIRDRTVELLRDDVINI